MDNVVNNSNMLNISAGNGDSVLRQDGVADQNLEAYTVVLSVAAHLLSMLFGGGSSIAVIIAITTRRNINKYSYTLVLTLFLACCCLNFIWSPLEIADLIMYHYITRHPCDGYLGIKMAIYLFLILVISIVIVLLSAEGIVRMKYSFGRMLRKSWPLLSCFAALVSAAFLCAIFIAKSVESNVEPNKSYVISDSSRRSVILALITVAFCITFIALLVLAIVILKETVYWEDGRPHLKQKKLKLAIPEFLISQSNACADNDGGYEHSQTGTPSPGTPKLLTVGDPDMASLKGEDAITELPSPMAKPMGNRLGINMAQVLGRRRHTICQISDSSTASTPADPISKAKQYNYVRKFSVDISALQAQLQNPKIFKEAPFQSDIDLSKKQASENAKQPPAREALLPLKPLPKKFDETADKPLENAKSEAESSTGALKIPPPPVIMVSNDDVQSNQGDEDNPGEFQEPKESFQQQTKQNPNANADTTVSTDSNDANADSNAKANSNAVAKKPTSLTFKDTLPEEHISAPTLESAVSEPSEAESEGQKMARLTLLLCLTFVLNMLPVFVTVLLDSSLSPHAFINISTCTLAVSVIQSIVYPHLIACSDDVVHKAVQKLKKRMKAMCSCSDADSHSQVEDSSSTSQV